MFQQKHGPIKKPTTVHLTIEQKRRGEQRAREQGISFHAWLKKIYDEAIGQTPAQSG